jgi:hypothetical protein
MTSRHTLTPPAAPARVANGRALLVLATLSLLALPAAAEVNVSGVALPATQEVEGKTLRLNGAGLRTRVVRLYVAGLYLEQPTTDAQEAIESEQVKRVELHVLRTLTRQQVGETIADGFRRNSAREMDALHGRLTQLMDSLPDVRRGDTLMVTYVPGEGTTVEGPQGRTKTIEGEDFAQALFSVWLGDDPVQRDLKQALLAGGPERVAGR